MKTLSGMLLYVTVQQPVDCFEKSKGKEWKASIVVDEDTADAFAEEFPKQSAKKIKRSEFKAKYNVDPPEGDEKNLYVITLKRNTQYKDKNGNMVDLPEQYRPQVKIKQDGELKVVTNDVLVGNGSVGQISLDIFESQQYGKSARLKNILVTELVEYVRNSREDGGDEFDDVPETKTTGRVVEGEKTLPKEEKKPTKSAKVKKSAEDDDDEDAPF